MSASNTAGLRRGWPAFQSLLRDLPADRPTRADGLSAVRAARAFLSGAEAAGRRVAAYGAPARGNTFLNAVGTPARGLAYAVDASPAKQGRVLPGTRIPIRAPSALREEPVDDVLVLPWDLAPEIAAQLADVRAAGARLLVGVPSLQVLDATGRPAGPVEAETSGVLRLVGDFDRRSIR